MDKWEYIVGVQIERPMETGEISCNPREIIKQGTPPEDWLNEKGAQGFELVTLIQRATEDPKYKYTEFFLKRKIQKKH